MWFLTFIKCQHYVQLFWSCPYAYAVIPSSGATLNNHTFSMETHWLMSITAMSQGVCVLDQSLKVSVPHFSNFLNVPTTFELIFLALNNNFQMRKFYVLRKSFNWKLISPNVSRDVQKPLFDLCMSHIVTILAGGITFSSDNISLCFVLFWWHGATLNNFGCVCLTETHAQWSSHFCISKRETVAV